MAKLSKDEQKLMQQLQAKMEAPDEPPMGKSVSFSIDLGDENQIKRAIKLGLLPGNDDDDDDDDSKKDDDDDDADHPPKRRSYFKE